MSSSCCSSATATGHAQEGLSRPYGAGVGRTLCQSGNASDWRISCCAAAAAGSDARMNGCALPVVINSGSGNQGITVSVPVIAYVRSQNCSEEQLFRALAVSNLLAIHQKKYIGKLSCLLWRHQRGQRGGSSHCLAPGVLGTRGRLVPHQHAGHCRRHSLRWGQGQLCGQNCRRTAKRVAVSGSGASGLPLPRRGGLGGRLSRGHHSKLWLCGTGRYA